MLDVVMEGSVGHLLMMVLFDEDKAREWLKTENANLGGSSPLTLIEHGRQEKVILFLEATLKGY